MYQSADIIGDIGLSQIYYIQYIGTYIRNIYTDISVYMLSDMKTFCLTDYNTERNNKWCQWFSQESLRRFQWFPSKKQNTLSSL